MLRDLKTTDVAAICEINKEALGYMGMPPYQYPDQWESAGFNTAGVGLSATESIFSSKKRWRLTL